MPLASRGICQRGNPLVPLRPPLVLSVCWPVVLAGSGCNLLLPGFVLRVQLLVYAFPGKSALPPWWQMVCAPPCLLELAAFNELRILGSSRFGDGLADGRDLVVPIGWFGLGPLVKGGL